jgi:methylglutaconyl-CoA hydratase
VRSEQRGPQDDAHPLVALRQEGPVAVVTLDEPERRNPLSISLVRSLTAVLQVLEQDDDVRAVVVTGAGKAFCAGADLRAMRHDSPLEDRRSYNEILVLNRLLWRYGKPTIAAVNGPALGAGANLVAWCDLAVADETAVLGYPEVRAGIASATVIASLLRVVGRKTMYEILLTGEPVTAAAAERLGLINRVVPHGQAVATAVALASRIAQHAPHAVQMTKEAVHVLTDMEYDRSLEHARDIRVLSRLDPAFGTTLDRYTARPDRPREAGQ